MKFLVWVLLLCLIGVTRAQNDTTPGAIAFTVDPIPDGVYSGHDVYPVIFPETMPKAANDLSAECDASLKSLVTWLGMNISLPGNVSRNDSMVVA